MYIVTFEEFHKETNTWYGGGGTFNTLDSAADFMAFALKMGGESYREVKLWKAEEVKYRISIIIEN